MDGSRQRCDLHVHSVHSTDSGNFALRRARMGESYTQPDRVYETCLRRGMTLVTITDHNTLEGALRIADRPNTFLSEEVTTRFPEDDVPLHVLVWDLSEEDHRDLQEYRPSVYELVDFLSAHGLHHPLAHPLYLMGAPLTMAHIERMLLLFRVWEVRGATSFLQHSGGCVSSSLHARIPWPPWQRATGSMLVMTGGSPCAPGPTTTERSTSRRRGPRQEAAAPPSF